MIPQVRPSAKESPYASFCSLLPICPPHVDIFATQNTEWCSTVCVNNWDNWLGQYTLYAVKAEGNSKTNGTTNF